MNLASILRNLTSKIPSPRKPVPEAQQSFASLKLGQRLTNRQGMYIGAVNQRIPAGSIWEVEHVNSQEAGLKLVRDEGPDVRLGVDRDWRDEFATAPKLVKSRV